MKQCMLFFLCTLVTISYASDQVAHLTPQRTRLPFFASLNAKQQEIQNENLRLASLLPWGDANYPIREKKMTNAIRAGAHVATVQQISTWKQGGLISQAVMFKDRKLLELMLECKDVDVHEIGSSLQYSAIHYAEEVLIAQPLIKKGALKDSTKITTLLLRTAMPQYEPLLIPLYIENGVDPLTCDARNRTLLMLLTQYPQQDMLVKAALLCKTLPFETIAKLLTAEDVNGKTIFDYIEQQLNRCKCYRENLNSLREFLVQKKFDLKVYCSLCERLCEYINIPCTITKCNRTFHTACLQQYNLERDFQAQQYAPKRS